MVVLEDALEDVDVLVDVPVDVLLQHCKSVR